MSSTPYPPTNPAYTDAANTFVPGQVISASLGDASDPFIYRYNGAGKIRLGGGQSPQLILGGAGTASGVFHAVMPVGMPGFHVQQSGGSTQNPFEYTLSDNNTVVWSIGYRGAMTSVLQNANVVAWVVQQALSPTGDVIRINSNAGVGGDVYRLGPDGRVYAKVPNSAPVDAGLALNQMSAYVDEAANLLKFRVRYSDGTYKTAQVALA